MRASGLSNGALYIFVKTLQSPGAFPSICSPKQRSGWEKILMPEKSVLITGSSGLIGRALCHRLGSMGYDVIGFDREGPPYPPPKTDCIYADQSSDESMQNAFHITEERHGNKLHAVIHLAAYYSFDKKESSLYDKIRSEERRVGK